MSVWDDLVGQDDVVEVLATASGIAARLLAGEQVAGLAHAWLFTGPPGSGRSNAARAFAACLLCAEQGCGTCQACRSVHAGTHPDLDLVTTEKVSFAIKVVRELVNRAQRHPSLGRWRVILVEDADRMSEASWNVLLKAIEEPPARTVWLLCTPSPQDVPPTIRSRCRSVRLRVPAPQVVAELLVRRDGVDPAMAAFAARAAQGHIGMARRLARDEAARNRRHEVLQIPFTMTGVGDAVIRAGELQQIAEEEANAATGERDAAEKAELLRALGVEAGATPPPAVRSQVTQLEKDQKSRVTRFKRDVLDRCLQDLLTVYRDVLMLQLGTDSELINPQLQQRLEKFARSGTPELTLHRMSAIDQARIRICSPNNLNPLMVLEAMTLRLVA